MVGDLANGRTVRSLCYLLAKYKDVKMYFVAPDVVRMRDDIKEYLTRHRVPFYEEEDLKEVASKVDVIYQTRIQKERFGDRIEDYERARGIYIINHEILDVMKPDAIIMHPLPRVDEIRERLTPIAGQPPNLASLPHGCPFVERCARARTLGITEKCLSERPPEFSLPDIRRVRCWEYAGDA